MIWRRYAAILETREWAPHNLWLFFEWATETWAIPVYFHWNVTLGLVTFGLSPLVTSVVAWPELRMEELRPCFSADSDSQGSPGLLDYSIPRISLEQGKKLRLWGQRLSGKPKSTTDSVVKVFLSSLYTVYAWATGNFKKEINFFQSCSQWDMWDPTELLQMEDSLYTLVLHCNFYQDFHLFLCLPGATKA